MPAQPVSPMRNALIELRLLSLEMRQQSRQIERWNTECRESIRHSHAVLAEAHAALHAQPLPIRSGR